LLLAALAACQSESPESLLAEARNYQQKGDRKAAQIQLKNLLSKQADHPEGRFLLAQVSLELSQPQAAEKEARRAMELGYQPDATRVVLMRSLLQQGEYEKVLKETDKLRERPGMLTIRGDALMGLRKLDEARATFEAALKAEPENATALAGLARHAALSNDYDTASRLADEALAKDAKDLAALTFKAEMLRFLGKAQQAEAAYAEVLKLAPEDRNAHLERAFLFMSQGKYDEAQQELTAARKNGIVSTRLLYSQALLDFSRGKYEAARDGLQQVLKLTDKHLPSVLLAGANYLNMGNLELAEQNLSAYLELTPSDSYARKLLATTRIRARQPTAALEALGATLADGEGDPDLLQLAGEANSMLRDHAKAAGYFEQAIRLDNKRPSLYMALGTARLALGDQARGISNLERAAAIDPRAVAPAIALAQARIAHGAPEKALQALQALEGDALKLALPHVLRGQALVALNKRKEARASLEQGLAADPRSFVAVAYLARLDIWEKNRPAAKQRLVDFVKKDEPSIDAMIALSQMAELAGNAEETRSWLARAVAEHPNDVAVALRLARYDARQGKAAQSVALLRKLQLTNPKDPALLQLLGAAEEAAGELAPALETMSKLAGVVPKSGLPHFRMAMIHLAQKLPDAAQRDLEKSLAVEPGYVPANLFMGQQALAQRNFDRALGFARTLQRLQPGTSGGYQLEGDVLLAQRKAVPAANFYAQALERERSGGILAKQVVALRIGNRADEADKLLAAWRQRHPDEPVGAMLEAEALMAKRQYAAAVPVLEQVVKLLPGNALAWNNLALSYDQTKDKRALETAERALKLAAEHPAVLDTVGWMRVGQGKVESGLPLLRKAAGLAPQAGEIRYHLGYALSKSGDKLQAKKELQLALASGNKFDQLDDARALLRQLD
jgi:putative PEP-CTERM system TPR-repeat lipoprotein